LNAAFTTAALLLRATDKGEDDRAVVLLTPDHGRVSALAKRARGSRRRFGAALQTFCLFEAALRPRAGGLIFLETAAALEFPLGAEPGWDSLAAGWLFLELADALSTQGTAQPAFFELLLGGLRRLGSGAEGPPAVRLSVLWGALAQAGWAPDPTRCVSCGSTGPHSDLALDPGRGGLLCPRCRPAGARVIPGAVVEQWEAASEGRPLGTVLPETEGPLLRWVEHHIGRALRTQALIGDGGPR
jgi:DNA repair protein RecO (recombination protein O)